MQDLGTFIGENLALIIAAVAGISLLVVEVFMPGFGVAGLGGAALMIGSVAMVWTRYGYAAGLWMTFGTLLLAGIAITCSLRSAKRGQAFRKLWGLKDIPLTIENSDVVSLVGRAGTAQTDLRPSGIASFDGVRMNVVSEGDYIHKGTGVIILKIQGNRIVVEKDNGGRPQTADA